MKAVEITEPGGAEVLKANTRPTPKARPGEVLVKVGFAGVNGPDLMQRRGLYPPPKGASDLLGLEVSGEVVAVGDGVARWSIGDRLCALTNGGGYAEYCAVDADHCMGVPDGLDLAEAASLPESSPTGWTWPRPPRCRKAISRFGATSS
jgi:NADPH:quinone reductase-like Zn-dependent oxidoreductase